jgi:hypothetical protein
MFSYKVKYRIGYTNAVSTIQLINGSESEAISKLKQNYAVPKDANVMILSIEKA